MTHTISYNDSLQIAVAGLSLPQIVHSLHRDYMILLVFNEWNGASFYSFTSSMPCKLNLQGCRKRGGGHPRFGQIILNNSISTRGADAAHHIITPSPDFQTYQHPFPFSMDGVF